MATIRADCIESAGVWRRSVYDLPDMYEPPARKELHAIKHRNGGMIISIIYIMVVIVATAHLLMLLLRHSQRRRNNHIRDMYVKQIASLMMSEKPSRHHIRARSRRSRMALAEAIYTVISHTYGNDTERLRPIVEHNNIERLLLKRVRLNRGATRARALMLLSAIPLHEDTVQYLIRHARSNDKEVRISALTAILASNPSMAIRTIASYYFELTPFDTARIIALLRRGLLPIAYEPLLASSNRNLQILGLAIVCNFGIEIAEKRLHKIISTEDDIVIVRKTIYTLASLGRPLGHTRIRERLAAMSADKRKELCRHLTVEGYSLSAVRSLFNERESLYAETLINSYKRALRASAT